MSSVRLWHTYIGIFIAPSVIFFAVTGALQIFNLHESHKDYEPSPFIEKLSSLHKDQVFSVKSHERQAPDARLDAKRMREPSSPDEEEDHPALATFLLKWFFLFVALALVSSTSLGLWIGLSHIRRKRTAWLVLLGGIVLPVALLVL